MGSILEELKEINKSIQYQTKILEEIFMKKEDSQAQGARQKHMMFDFIGAVSETFKTKGMDTSPFEKILKSIGGDKNEHQIP
jgi:hypothetical protein